MKLSEILKDLSYTCDNFGDCDITDIAYDSRKCGEGILFVCLVGAFTDGHKYIQSAYDKGSRVFLCEREVDLPDDAMVIITDNTRDMIEQLDEELKVDIKNVTYFQVDIAGIVDACENEEVKPELAELNDLFTYSDPVSNDETRPLEDEIKELLKELRGIIDEGSTEDIKKLIKKIKLALNERNRVCKVSK